MIKYYILFNFFFLSMNQGENVSKIELDKLKSSKKDNTEAMEEELKNLKLINEKKRVRFS